MPILSYSDIFANLGQVIVAINEAGSQEDDWLSFLADIQTSYESQDQQVALSSAISTIDGIRQSLASLRPSLAVMCDARLQDYSSVVDPLAIPTNDIATVLYAFINAMVTDAATVNANVVTIGSVTAGALNVGNGTILIDGVLDGFSVPVNGGSAHPAMNGRNSEFPVSETVTVTCNSDSYADGLTAGQEQFEIHGQLPPENLPWGLGELGSSNGPTLNTLQAGSILQNMSFEEWSVTDTPDSWSIIAGVVTTNVARESSIVYRGTYAVKLIGTGAAATISIGQDVAATQINPLRRYCVSFRYRISTTDTASQTFSVKFSGTGYAEGTTEKVTVLGDVMPTSYTLGYFFVNMPATVPSDFKLLISWAGTPASGKTVYVDDIGFDAVTWHGGLAFVAVAGSTNFVRNDSWTSVIVNSYEGVINWFMIRNYVVQLPSLTTGAETISDNLAM